MTSRNNHGYIILLAIVVVAGILVAMLARLATKVQMLGLQILYS